VVDALTSKWNDREIPPFFLYNMTMYDQKHPFNADEAVLQDGVPSDRWIQKNHPDALKVRLYDEMIHATQKDFVVYQIEIARNKGYSVRLQGSFKWTDPNPIWDAIRKNSYSVMISRYVWWTCKGVVGSTWLGYNPMWPKSQGMISGLEKHQDPFV
jgi:hypothetical protein